ncbi:MAG: glycosyltransferase [Geobacteraceae bacterium]|nr:glycosyltransferase [Geobacteraceae bacterium]
MNPMPLITVIVPVFNTQKYLTKCIDSIINQSYQNLQILLIDDGSTDNSSQICDIYAARDSRVCVVHKDNKGVSSARNLGVERAKGDYVSFIDSDDWLEPHAYEHLVCCILEHKVDAVIFEYFVDYEGVKSVHKTFNRLNGLMNNVKAIETTISPVNRFAWSKLYARSLVCDIRFEEGIHIGEDTLFACHALGKAGSVFYLSTPLYHHVQSEVSATRCAFNEKRFTGIEAYHRLLLLCQSNYSDITDIALSAYISLIISTIVELRGCRNYPGSGGVMSDLNHTLRSNFMRVLRSDKIENRVKVRLLLCCISPWLPYMLHKRHRLQSY